MQRSQTFRRKIDAEKHVRTIEYEQLTGTYIEAKRGLLTMGDWAERWMGDRVHLKPKTVASYESLLRTQILPTWRVFRWGRCPTRTSFPGSR